MRSDGVMQFADTNTRTKRYGSLCADVLFLAQTTRSQLSVLAMISGTRGSNSQDRPGV
jgi:hypothetical protein